MKRSAIALAALAALPFLNVSQAGSAPDVFIVLDQDTNGIVTYDEAMAHRTKVYFMYDLDTDGFLNEDEYASLTQATVTPLEQDGLRKSFNDVDNDGRVSMGEFLSRSLDWLWLLDRNGDGSVTSADYPAQS